MNEYVVTVNSTKKNIKCSGNGIIELGDTTYEVELSKVNKHSYLLKIGNKIYNIVTNKANSENYSMSLDGRYYELTVRTLLREKATEYLKNQAKLSHHSEVKAPMPGLVLSVKKNVGDRVEFGESLFILEAMKMENDIRSNSSGVIEEILVDEGKSVEKGETIIVIK
ncbi:MAG: hypothetical protein K9J16_02820 [Melioribacteraceae bacterium]|nr:hypothetical protein [Melioribacteraceae bacterium]MCF8352941.1 hypothetical protein [Melioribacteraceae bacterium]MCF8395877.1 hypothetical protein [Melioribacteraceae bacterium]MCF8417458.1 hypothetical protein [Melioribacteraceae bacterium]